MKLTVEITLDKLTGRACGADEVFDTLTDDLSQFSVYVQPEGAEDETQYEISNLRHVKS